MLKYLTGWHLLIDLVFTHWGLHNFRSEFVPSSFIHVLGRLKALEEHRIHTIN